MGSPSPVSVSMLIFFSPCVNELTSFHHWPYRLRSMVFFVAQSPTSNKCRPSLLKPRLYSAAASPAVHKERAPHHLAHLGVGFGYRSGMVPGIVPCRRHALSKKTLSPPTAYDTTRLTRRIIFWPPPMVFQPTLLLQNLNEKSL